MAVSQEETGTFAHDYGTKIAINRKTCTIYGFAFSFCAKEGGVVRQLILFLSLSAIGTIFYALLKVVSLNKRIPGGIVKESWKLLYYLIGLLGVGYLTMPLLPGLPETSRELIIAIIFLAGAIFILKVVNLFNKIIKEVGL